MPAPERVFVSEQTCSSCCLHRCGVSYHTQAFDGRQIKSLEEVVGWVEVVSVVRVPKIRNYFSKKTELCVFGLHQFVCQTFKLESCLIC